MVIPFVHLPSRIPARTLAKRPQCGLEAIGGGAGDVADQRDLGKAGDGCAATQDYFVAAGEFHYHRYGHPDLLCVMVETSLIFRE